MSIREKIQKYLPVSVQRIIFKCRSYDKPCGYGEKYSETLEKAFATFLTESERNDRKLVCRLKNDIIDCWIKYKALPYEYFLFDFKNRTDAERGEFETDIDRIATLCKVCGKRMYMEEINDKYNFYLLAKSYFKREAIKLDHQSGDNDFVAFVRKYKDVFIKPLAASKGVGTHVYCYDNDVKSKTYYQHLMKEGDSWIVEERIRQCDDMAQWNPTSVNTIRIPTFLRDGKFTVIWTRMRMGKKGSVVDNAGAGGIVVNVDPQTGIVTTDGIDEAYNHFEQHPDAGLTFKGWQVPRWQELLQVVEELHRTVFPKHIYIAWDFALTDAGWVVIEGNWGQLLGQQTASQVGEKRRFHELLGA